MDALQAASSSLHVSSSEMLARLQGSQSMPSSSTLKLHSSLSWLERLAVSHSSSSSTSFSTSSINSMDEEQVFQILKNVEWGIKGDQVLNLVKDFNRLRARRTGLQMRNNNLNLPNQARDEVKPNERGMGEERVENIEMEKKSLEEEVEALRDEETQLQSELEAIHHERVSTQQKAQQIQHQADQLVDHLKDLTSIDNGNEMETCTVEIDASEKRKAVEQRVTVAESRLAQFCSQAKGFEDQKLQVCLASESLQVLLNDLEQRQNRLDLLQEENRARQAALERVNASNRSVLLQSLQKSKELMQTSQGVKDVEQTIGFAVSLGLLCQNGGEMLLKDWKEEIAKMLSRTNAQVVQVVYGLVANSLVKIDRSQAEPRAFSLLHVSL